MLVRWLRARFPDHPIPDSTMEALRKHTTWDTHQRILDVFLALSFRPQAASIGRTTLDRFQVCIGVAQFIQSPELAYYGSIGHVR